MVEQTRNGPTRPASIIVDRDIVYGTGKGEELRLDLARPKETDGPLTCVVVIHGGGWFTGDKSVVAPIAERFARNGFAAAAVGYRLVPAHRFPAQIEDVKCAVRFLRAHSVDYEINPERVGALGISAGAHLAMLLGVTNPNDGLEGEGGWADRSSKVKAVVSYFGPTELSAPDIPPDTRRVVEDFLGGTVDEIPDIYRTASPISHVGKGSAPMLLFQGTSDVVVPHTQAYLMIDALTKAGGEGRAELLIGEGHGWEESTMERTLDESTAFFREFLSS